ncbi:JAB domain-containing protein [Neoroseomonas lacus]|uniref:DNA repair protein RadC n=1 Tax=Neoroseomonas lacus TaxID=287609 RepID=A0A917KTQ4_9PROT|nr:JAB domain-containing protein [Neoroseomonas lacus]GGJ29535.1 DNA repair protein RadC [Neoroseomonas lacus]
MDAFAFHPAAAPALPPSRHLLAPRRTSVAAAETEDREILYALLAPCLGCMEAAEAVEAVIARFGGLAEAIAAEPRDLASLPELGEAGAAALRAVMAAALRLERMRRSRRPMLTRTAAVLAHLRRGASAITAGELRALFLDARGALLAEETVGPGAASAVPGQVIRRALALEADGIVLVRGCEGGDPVPSDSDVAMARSLDQAATVMGLRLREHLVLGRTAHAAMRDAGQD